MKEKHENIITATYKVIKAALIGNVDPSYEYQFPERKVLHEQTPSHVQAVNQHLDKEGIDLESQHVEHFNRGTKIDNHTPLTQSERARKYFKTLKNESKIADSFNEEAKKEQAKGDNADQRKIVYAKSGCLAHTLFGAGKAATNPYFAHEEGFAIGCTSDYLLSSKNG